MTNKVCVVCETPYQIFNAINLKITAYRMSNVDIFIGRVFYNSEKIIKKVREENIFNHVFSYSNKRIGFTWKFKELFVPLKYVDYLLDEKFVVNSKYDEILVSSTTHFSMALIAANRSANVVYYDDGIGSYTDNIGFQNITVKRKLCYILGNRHTNRFFFHHGFLYRPDLLIHPQGKRINKIEFHNTQLAYERLFEYQYDSVYENRIVYFATPSQDFQGKAKEKDFIEVLNLYSENCSIRLHPREQHPNSFRFTSLDNGKNHWEMIAMNQINDQHILIGMFSTAQIVPKIIFDKEPYIVFTYKLYENLFNEVQRVNQDAFVHKLKSIYRRPQKIIVVQNINEFNEAVKLCLGDSNE